MQIVRVRGTVHLSVIVEGPLVHFLLYVGLCRLRGRLQSDLRYV